MDGAAPIEPPLFFREIRLRRNSEPAVRELGGTSFIPGYVAGRTGAATIYSVSARSKEKRKKESKTCACVAFMLSQVRLFMGRHPLAANICTSAVLFSAGDAIAQRSSAAVKEEKTDLKRNALFSLYGGAIFAPTQHYWFAIMEKYVGINAKTALRATMSRVVVHTLIYAPFSIATTFAWMCCLHKRGTFEEIVSSASPDRVVPVWIAGGAFWIPAMAFIYGVVPLQLRVITNASGNVLWTAYLSMKGS